MADKPQAAEGEKAPAKSKKKLIIIVAAVLVLVLAGGGGTLFYMAKQRAAAAAAEEEGGDGATQHAAAGHDKKIVPPAYLPMENLVVNLADPGGDRVAQVGITLVVKDAQASDMVKGFLPTIRSSVLKLIAQRTADELLVQEGKEKLAKDVLRAASVPFGGGEDEEEEDHENTKKKKKKKAHAEYPVIDVLFSNFIVQ